MESQVTGFFKAFTDPFIIRFLASGTLDRAVVELLNQRLSDECALPELNYMSVKEHLYYFALPAKKATVARVTVLS